MRRTRQIGLLFIFVTLFSGKLAQNGLRTLLQWKELEYSFPSNADRLYAINRGLYVHGNGFPLDVDVHYGDRDLSRIFVTIPRFTSGIPYTLATVSNLPAEGGPQLQAFPDYSWHSSHGQDCNGITSVFRVAVDECERLWVLDTGRIGSVQHCTPQLLIFNLRTNSLLHRYRFPQSQFKTAISLLVTPIVDVRDPPSLGGTCRNVMVYIADVAGFGLLVYDYRANTSWRIENKLMYPYPDYGTFTIAGESFDLMDGVLGLSVTPMSIIGGPRSVGGRNEARKDRKQYGGGWPYAPEQSRPPREAERHLYFHSLASAVENRVPLDLIDNGTIWATQQDAHPRAFTTIGSRGQSSAAQAMDSKGNLYFGLNEDIGIASWNINTPYNRNNFKMVAQNRDTLQFMSGMKVKRSRRSTEELWGVSTRFQKVFSGTKNSNEVNFRILGCNVDELQSTGCRNADQKENIIFV